MVIETSRRRFSFNKEDYHMSFTGKKRQQAKRLISYGIKNDRSPQEVLKSLKSKGLGYRKTNFLADYARGQATEYSKTKQSYGRAKNFWGSVVNIKERDNIKYYPTAVQKIKEFEKRDYAGTLTSEDIKELERLSPIGEYVFGVSPVW